LHNGPGEPAREDGAARADYTAGESIVFGQETGSYAREYPSALFVSGLPEICEKKNRVHRSPYKRESSGGALGHLLRMVMK